MGKLFQAIDPSLWGIGKKIRGEKKDKEAPGHSDTVTNKNPPKPRTAKTPMSNKRYG